LDGIDFKRMGLENVQSGKDAGSGKVGKQSCYDSEYLTGNGQKIRSLLCDTMNAPPDKDAG
jgi:hypothetical protein